MKKDIKTIVEDIQKTGQLAPWEKPAPNRSVSYQAPHPTNKEVFSMQEALINLYDSFKYYPMFNKDQNYREQNIGEYTESFEHGSDSFLTFLLNRYVNKSPIVGQEAFGTKQTGAPINFVRMLESLRTLGKNQVSKPDGLWGNYTTNALKNTYAIAQAMLGLMNKLKTNSNDYTQADLEELGVDLQKRTPEAAQKITTNIAKLKKLLGDFMHTILAESGKYNGYIKQDKPFETNFSDKTHEYDVRDYQVLKAETASGVEPVILFTMPKDIITNEGQSAQITLQSILGKQNFNSFIKENAITVGGKDPLQDNDARNKLLDYIEEKVKSLPIQKAVR
jgi:hypothetical protein